MTGARCNAFDTGGSSTNTCLRLKLGSFSELRSLDKGLLGKGLVAEGPELDCPCIRFTDGDSNKTSALRFLGVATLVKDEVDAGLIANGSGLLSSLMGGCDGGTACCA